GAVSAAGELPEFSRCHAAGGIAGEQPARHSSIGGWEADWLLNGFTIGTDARGADSFCSQNFHSNFPRGQRSSPLHWEREEMPSCLCVTNRRGFVTWGCGFRLCAAFSGCNTVEPCS